MQVAKDIGTLAMASMKMKMENITSTLKRYAISQFLVADVLKWTLAKLKRQTSKKEKAFTGVQFPGLLLPIVADFNIERGFDYE